MATPASKPWLRPHDQRSLALLAALGLLGIAGYWVFHNVWGSGLSAFDQAPPLTVQFQVDVNRADWPELMQLPGVGPTLARRVVENRQAHGAFETIDQLARVRGLGPRTIDRIRPYAIVGAKK